jgi:hypothetical protein
MGSNPIGVTNINLFQSYKHADSEFIRDLKTSICKVTNRMIDESTLSDIERKAADWLAANMELKLKDYFLADLSWANNEQEKHQAFIDFFTKRPGKRVLDILPEDIRNHVLANSL